MSKIKTGDRVRIKDGYHDQKGVTGTVFITGVPEPETIVTLDEGFEGWTQQAHYGEPNPGAKGWYMPLRGLVKLEDSVSLETQSPSIADDLRLKPQARKILRHLRSGKTISPLEAQNVYGVYRLAASIFDIRQLGYNVKTVRKQDEAGHKYARYSLAA